MKKIIAYISTLILLIPCLCLAQQENVDTAILSGIRTEAMSHSKVMHFAEYLTEVAGPRLTNSPGFSRAANWAVNSLKSMGLSNVHLESWGNFGRGWSIENCSIAMQSPYYMPVIGYPFAWTNGTNGPVTADVVLLNSLNADSLKRYGSSLKGKIILVMHADTILPTPFKACAERYSDSALEHMGDTYMISNEELHGMMKMINEWKTGFSLLQQMGCLAVLNMSGGDRDGTVSASLWFTAKKGAWPDMPAINLAPEHYLLMQRLLQHKVPVSLTLNVQTKFYDKDPNGYNVIAEIPGSDPLLKNEVVMIGGHLDSWYAGTGATDNAAGCAVMMEAIRIFQSLHIQPKRTIRIALWSGEEQGLLGSYGYVLKHFGNAGTMALLPEQSKISAYYNLDNGSGKIRGIFMQGNTEAAPLFKNWLAPLSDLGANTVTLSNTGSTDHFSFDAVGIPAFEFIQDPMEYESRTHHTNMDTYDHLFPDDLKQASLVVASVLYHTAMRNDKIPRKALPAAKPWLFEEFR